MRKAFLRGTGDVARYNTSILANLIDSGVNVAMAYGDYDLQCNCAQILSFVRSRVEY
jgi:hypothetical protein